MKECEEDHFEGEDDCIMCSYEEEGGNWKRFICKIIGHDFGGPYSWWLSCDRCYCNRYRKGINFTSFGDGYIVGSN